MYYYNYNYIEYSYMNVCYYTMTLSIKSNQIQVNLFINL